MPMRITGMNSGLDTEAMVQELVSAYKKKGEKTSKEKTKLEWKQDIWKDLNKKVKSFNKKIQNLKYSSSFNLKKTTSSNENKATVIAGENAPKGNQTLKIKHLAQSSYMTSGELFTTNGSKVTGLTTLGELGVGADGTKIELYNKQTGEKVNIDANKDTTISEFVNNLKENGIDASFDESTKRLFLSSKDTGEKNAFELREVDENGNAYTAHDVLGKLGLREAQDGEIDRLMAELDDEVLTPDDRAYIQKNIDRIKGFSEIKAQDAEIELNGATFKSSTNNFNVNGLTITAKDTTAEGETITLTTAADTDGIYNQIKDIIKEYSSLINELDKLYNADNAKGYEPLTDDEKDALSDKEIEKWETKIKDSLLRRDSNVSAISSAMKQSSLQKYNVNGTDYTLADFGIGTLSYFLSGDNEKNALHIDGDPDDVDVASNTNKLKKMIADNPDAVTGFFQQFMSDLSDRFTKLSATSSMRSYGNFFDDKKVSSDLTKYEKKVADWEEYVKKIEDKYYKQFSKMETQLAKLNSTQTSLSNYFGGGA